MKLENVVRKKKLIKVKTKHQDLKCVNLNDDLYKFKIIIRKYKKEGVTNVNCS